jgi:hypothetical protein
VKRRLLEKHLDKLQYRLGTAERRKEWDAVLHYDEQIDWLSWGWHASPTGVIGKNLGERPASWWEIVSFINSHV